jgi:hypothetical protein
MAESAWSRPQPTLRRSVRELITRDRPVRERITTFVRRVYPILSLPAATAFILSDREIRPEYGMNWLRRIGLAVRLYRNTRRTFTGCSYRAHLVMAAKLLEIPSTTEGVVVECGSYLGGTTANLSIVCDIVGRDLIVYDSFEGLPPPRPGDRYAADVGTGFLRGDLERVRDNVARNGVVDRCTFRQGWFSDTLPHHTEPIVLAFLDVDYEASIHDCLVNLWPHLTDTGYLFTDDYPILELSAVFYSERFWQRWMGRTPPGLFGAGGGVGVGQYWVGPYTNIGGNSTYPLQEPGSIAYTRKDFSAEWTYDPDGT